MAARRLISLVASLALVGTLFYVSPASAQLPQITAGVNIHELVVGNQRAVQFTVANPMTAADDIRYVNIHPNDLAIAMRMDHGSTGPGWDFGTTGNGKGARFSTSENGGDTIPPGESEVFTVFLTPGTRAADGVFDWLIETQTDREGGGAETVALPSAAGALTENLRVLSLDAIAITGPAGVVDNSATAGQAGVRVRSVVSNHGSQALTVTPSQTLGTSDIVTSAPAAASIPAGGNRAFDYVVTMGPSGTRQLEADASAAGANGIVENTGSNTLKSLDITVMSPALFSYFDDSLTPRASVSGASQIFNLQVTKTGQAAAGLNNQTALTFTRPDGRAFSATLATPVNIPTAGQAALSFPKVIPGTPGNTTEDGDYVGSIRITGTDENGAAIDQTVALATDNIFSIDNLMPAIVPTITGPASQRLADGTAVVKDGDTLTFGGTIKRNAADTGNDGSAVITTCDVVVLAASNGSPAGEVARHAATCNNNGGQIAGSLALPATGLPLGFVRLDVAARDTAGNASTPAPSVPVLIDNTAPILRNAVTVDTKTIKVNLSEPVRGTFQPVDFTVPGNNVLQATSTCTATVACDSVTLTLLQTFGADATPTVNYALTGPAPLRTRPTDAPGQTLANASVQALDRISPALPSVTGITQVAMQDDGTVHDESFGADAGTFYTNDSTPTYAISGLGSGYTAFLALDSNGNGAFDEGTDLLLATCPAVAATVECAGGTLFGENISVLAFSTDSAGNTSAGTGTNAKAHPVVLDTAAPTAVGFAYTQTAGPPQATKQVAVTLNEPLPRGRNAAADWTAVLVNGDQHLVLWDTTVAGSGVSRTINLDTRQPGVDRADYVLYIFEGKASARYRDRAGNYVPNFEI